MDFKKFFELKQEDYFKGKEMFEHLVTKEARYGYLKKYCNQEKLAKMFGWTQSKVSKIFNGKLKGKLIDRRKLYEVNEMILTYLLINQKILINRIDREIKEIEEINQISSKEAGRRRNNCELFAPEELKEIN